MSGIECINLLAFIQFIIAFDFGLYYLDNKHVLTEIYRKYQKDLKLSVRAVLSRANDIITKSLKSEDNECILNSAYLDKAWINDAIDVSSLNILGPKKFFAETFKTLYRSLSDNTVMQKLLLYEMSVINETTKRTAETRDIMNLNLIAFYDNLFRPAKINIKAIMANLIGGIYYLILHRRCAKTCTIDFNTQEGEKVFFEWIDFLTDAIFDKLEAYERNRKAAQEMLSDGISEFKICKYMGINKNDLRILLSK